MKKPYTSFVKALMPGSLSMVLLLAALPGHAQEGECYPEGGCAAGTAFGELQVTNTNSFQAAVPNTQTGRYNTFGVVQGMTYEWSMCPTNGASVPANSDTQLTLRNAQGQHICYSDDICGLHAKILWTATFTGEVRVQINHYYCETNTATHTMVWRCVDCGAIGINEISLSLPVSAWPNPANDQLNLSFGDIRSGILHYAIVDALGREVLQGNFNITPEEVLSLDISGLAPGQYIFRGMMDDHNATRIFVKI